MTTMSQLKKDHQALLAQYIDLLNEVSKLPLVSAIVVGPQKETPKRSRAAVRGGIEIQLPIALRYLVWLFTESHIRGKLLELSVAYSFFAQQNQRDKRFVTWLKETSGDCEKLAATLVSWQSIRGLVGGLWPIGVGILTAWLNLENIYQVVTTIKGKPIDWITLGLVVFPMIYVLFFISFSFLKKRQMFLRGSFVDERQTPPEKIDNIVYHLEDKVFNQIGRGKVREFPTDILGQASVFLGFAVFEMTIWIGEPPGFGRIFFGGAAIMFAVAAVGSIFQLQWRKWT